jgi:hypothetical protein
MRRMMKNKYRSITIKLFTLLMGMFLAVTLFGCSDTIVADMEAEHQRLGVIARQDLQQNMYMSPSPMDSQTTALYPAP